MMPTTAETIVPIIVDQKNFLKAICLDTYACWTELKALKISLNPKTLKTGVSREYSSQKKDEINGARKNNKR